MEAMSWHACLTQDPHLALDNVITQLCDGSGVPFLQMRKAGLMAALSQKAQQGQLVIMDRLFLSSDHARIVFEKLLYRHIDTFKQTGNYKVQPAWLRRAVMQALPPGMLTGLIGITNESGRLMTSPFNDRTIVENIMRELDHREEDYGSLMAKTGVRRKQ